MPRGKHSNFGEVVSHALATSNFSQRKLAEELNVNSRYVNHLMTGHRTASAHWADLVADVLKLSAEQRVQLHRAAAKDKGYKLDLTPK